MKFKMISLKKKINSLLFKLLFFINIQYNIKMKIDYAEIEALMNNAIKI